MRRFANLLAGKYYYKKTIGFFSITFLFLIFGLTFYLSRRPQDLRSKAQLQPSQSTDLPLYVYPPSTNIKVNDKYTLSIYDDFTKKLLYTGYLFVKSQSCTSANICQNYSGPWVDLNSSPYYVKDGQITLDSPQDPNVKTLRMRFTTTDPVKKTDWSNEVMINISP